LDEGGKRQLRIGIISSTFFFEFAVKINVFISKPEWPRFFLKESPAAGSQREKQKLVQRYSIAERLPGFLLRVYTSALFPRPELFHRGSSALIPRYLLRSLLTEIQMHLSCTSSVFSFKFSRVGLINNM
jgi:hypothetical protein